MNQNAAITPATTPSTPVVPFLPAEVLAREMTSWGRIKAVKVYENYAGLANNPILHAFVSGTLTILPFAFIPQRFIATRSVCAVAVAIGVYNLLPYAFQPLDRYAQSVALPRLQSWAEGLSTPSLQHDFLEHVCQSNQDLLVRTEQPIPYPLKHAFGDLALTSKWLENPVQPLEPETIDDIARQDWEDALNNSRNYSRERYVTFKTLLRDGVAVEPEGDVSTTPQKLLEVYHHAPDSAANQEIYLSAIDLPGADWQSRPAIDDSIEGMQAGDKMFLLATPDSSDPDNQYNPDRYNPLKYSSTFGLFKKADGSYFAYHPRYGYFHARNHNTATKLVDALMRCNQKCTRLAFSLFRKPETQPVPAEN